MRLASLSEPFDSADWIFELKYDGFRAVAEIASGECRLFSRNRNVYRRFAPLAQSLARVIRAETVLDGEVVCLDPEGRPQFYDLLRRRVEPVFVAFDILALNGEDLRHEPLIARKRVLRSVLPKNGPVLYAGFVEPQKGGCMRAPAAMTWKEWSPSGSTAATCALRINRLIEACPGWSRIHTR